MNRRQFLVASGAAGMGGITAGCMDILTGDGITVSAEKATVADSVLTATGFQHVSTNELSLNKEISAAGETREIDVTSWISTFIGTPSLDTGGDQALDSTTTTPTFDELIASDATMFSIFTTPSKTIAGEEVNPAAHFTNERVFQETLNLLGSNTIKNITKQGTTRQTILGQETQVTIFSGTIESENGSQSVILYNAEVRNEGDIVVPMGIHPDAIDAEQTLLQLMGGINHPQ